MTTDNFLDNLSTEEMDLSLRIFDLVTGRAIKKVYLSLSQEDKKVMEEVFLSEDNGKKEKFFEEYAPNFKEIFKEEAETIEGEIKEEIEKQI